MHLTRRGRVWFETKPTKPRDEPLAPRVITPSDGAAFQHELVLVCQEAESSHRFPSRSLSSPTFWHCDFVDVDSGSDAVV